MISDMFRQTLAWARAHKVRALFLVVLLYLFFELATIPYFSIARLATENPQETALMRQRIDEAGTAGKTLKIAQRWIPLRKIPRQTLHAIVVAEDGTFYTHGGLDWFEIRASMERNVKEGRAARGASTITQQLAKNLYLSTAKTPLRKLKEVVITFLLESRLSKDRILEIYVNVIEWGRGIFGIDAASRAYFGKSASALTLDESLRLAAVIPSPLTHRPNSNSRYVLRRKQIVLNRMWGRRQADEEADPADEETESEPDDTDVAPAAPVPDTIAKAPDGS
jgi:monofunctional biosynthetic peptidoglycan transglycosylase